MYAAWILFKLDSQVSNVERKESWVGGRQMVLRPLLEKGRGVAAAAGNLLPSPAEAENKARNGNGGVVGHLDAATPSRSQRQ